MNLHPQEAKKEKHGAPAKETEAAACVHSTGSAGQSPFGYMAESVRIVGNIFEPIDVEWEAEKACSSPD